VASRALQTDRIKPPNKTALVALAIAFELSVLVLEMNWAWTPLNRMAYCTGVSRLEEHQTNAMAPTRSARFEKPSTTSWVPKKQLVTYQKRCSNWKIHTLPSLVSPKTRPGLLTIKGLCHIGRGPRRRDPWWRRHTSTSKHTRRHGCLQ
jgi:hypothetical protein